MKHFLAGIGVIAFTMACERKDEMEKPWAFPVVANGRLYLRDHGRVWCYDVQTGVAR